MVTIPPTICRHCEQNGVRNCIACKAWPCDLCLSEAARIRTDLAKK